MDMAVYEILALPVDGAEDFTMLELLHSDTAEAEGIDNLPHDDEVYDNLKYLARTVLQPLRDWAGVPLVVTSGYRSPALNKRIGGSPTSFHSLGCAADIRFIRRVKRPESELFDHIARHLPFTELIAEGIPNGWVHVALQRGREEEKAIKYMLDSEGFVRRSSYDEVMKWYAKFDA